VDGVELIESSHELREHLNDFELRVRRDLNTSTDQTETALALVTSANNFSDEFKSLENSKKKLDTLGRVMLEKAHPRSIPSINDLLKGVNLHWEQVDALLAERVAAVRDLHSQLVQHDASMNELDTFRVEQSEILHDINDRCERTWDLPEIQK
jgi:hypothetical protein